MWPHAAGGDARVKIAQKGVLCAGNTHKRMRRYVAGSVMVWAIVVLAASAVNAQEAIVDTAANGAGSGLGSPQSLLDVIGQAGGFQWPILGVFVLGMAAVIQALVRVQGEKRRARALAGLTVPVAKTSDFEIATQQGGDSLHHRIMDAIMKRLELDASSEGLLAAAERAVERARARATRTRRLVEYCSNAAGGLGFAGTLVAMYLSFASAGTDTTGVFVGISLALVSTFLGLAASLILEAAQTFVSRQTVRHQAAASEWGEAVCLRLAAMATRLPPSMSMPPSQMG